MFGRMKRCGQLAAVLLLLLSFLSGCGYSNEAAVKKAKADGTCLIYCTDMEQEQLVSLNTNVSLTAKPEEAVKELIDTMAKMPAKEGYMAALPVDVKLNGYTYADGLLAIDFSSDYARMKTDREIICRAAYVKTLTQVAAIDRVVFTLDGQPLNDADGIPVGEMSNDSFVDNSTYSLDQYEKASFRFYFANAEGDALVPEEREIRYSKSRPLAQAIVEQLAKGPQTEGLQATIPSDVHLLAVTTRDGICYLNFNGTFPDQVMSVSDKAEIYSIVNTVAEAAGVESVQISINGNSNLKFHESIDFSEPLTPDQDLVQGE